MDKKMDSKTIVVTGDVTIDWNIARMPRMKSAARAWTADEVTAALCQPGGAAILSLLIDAVAKTLRDAGQVDGVVKQVNLPRVRLSPIDSRFHHSYAMWMPFFLDESKPSLNRVWRVQEFLGLNPAQSNVVLSEKPATGKVKSPRPDIVIIDDANLGFRGQPNEWNKIITNTARTHVLVKMAKPVAQGKLWEYLVQNHAERLTVVMLAEDLRASQVQISRQISWERTAQDLVWELINNPRVKTLAQCAHVIVIFDTAGVVLLSKNARSMPEAVLFFDPNAMEGEWGQNHMGYMIGYDSCLTAGIARELMLNTRQPNVARGIQRGTRAMRFLHVEGYGRVNSDEEPIRLAFPVAEIAGVLAEDKTCLATAVIKIPSQATITRSKISSAAKDASFWTILEDKNPDSLEGVAEQIVLEGMESALPEVPIGRFGNLRTVDRREIESLHSICNLIRDYCQGYKKAPLSIAVFGPPGAGKSFAVKEVANSVLPGGIETLTFNLSQFAGLENLFDAFHQVRDKALTGKIPLVFWDEFDTQLQQQPLGWLRYFLAPMQDGEFQEGQINHPIGRSIFVFAGSSSYDMESFGANLDDAKRRDVKLPDFASRLKGFLNILGPNRQVSENEPGRTKDIYYVIRRAIMLRSIIERIAPQLISHKGNKRTVNIDRGVLRAFLLTSQYKHGVRSMEAIVSMSQLASKASFERSCLPSETQLSLHVDGRDFSSIMHRLELDSDLLEKLAEVVHEAFCDDMRSKGWAYGPVTRQDRKEHSSLKPYSELPENEKEQNRNNAWDIQNKLIKVGYTAIPMRGDTTPCRFSKKEIEILAQEEHQRWMAQKLADHWKPASETNKKLKQHQDLVPWSALSDIARQKDRTLIRSIPKILARAGYTIVKSTTTSR